MCECKCKLPNSALFSESLVKRSFAVMGHLLLANVIVYGIAFLLVFIIAIVVGALAT